MHLKENNFSQITEKLYENELLSHKFEYVYVELQHFKQNSHSDIYLKHQNEKKKKGFNVPKFLYELPAQFSVR